ncbi:acyl-CoA dehydrogenase, C-terminal domain protein [Pseudoramibacter alactolyticus ATCC 23263]|jgi:butyryl-CoA dehydrogenase|uniref:Acyl-CoA dehydrogenase, C-terminal domain protein n=1 Tax=Pseudoramibacter alactolyticus ATCC 23263 TaxID=887929 RepID=E6MHP3_9FIRM|nr:acyl-CoA dehydrogenase family protein [Pseudoramibacter alactolyticus]EFV01365.1 acyl-CoA dehydrogenase, C-terminal domain protein [Pseudoramibacter alactolyticus ATCC 23263]MBM6968393.1 acyl-CoA dehydrogenase family protein [Pseudoramibacter alactolyticus]
MAYLISDEAKDLLRDIHEFCEQNVVEQAKEYDKTGEFPAEMYEAAKEMGLNALEIPEEYGGPGLSRVDVAALFEEMAVADAGFATTISASGLGTKPVLIAGNEDQKARVCDILVNGGFGAFGLTEPGAGSDPGAGKTVAVKDGDDYILNGQKCFITNGGIADFYCITALTDKEAPGTHGMSIFLVEKDTPGLSHGVEEDKMGIRLSNTTDVILEDVRVPKENLLGGEGKGFAIAMKTLDQARAWMGVVSTGLAQRAMNEAIAYTKERKQFGRPVLKFQAMQFKIADMAIKIEASRQMNAYALTLMDQGVPFSREAAIAKCFASDTAMECTTEAVQMFGGYGYIRDYPVEKLMRDAKIFQIFEGTNEIQRIVTANNTIGRF